jgi:hypothetical protein
MFELLLLMTVREVELLKRMVMGKISHSLRIWVKLERGSVLNVVGEVSAQFSGGRFDKIRARCLGGVFSVN